MKRNLSEFLERAIIIDFDLYTDQISSSLLLYYHNISAVLPTGFRHVSAD